MIHQSQSILSQRVKAHFLRAEIAPPMSLFVHNDKASAFGRVYGIQPLTVIVSQTVQEEERAPLSSYLIVQPP